MRVLNMSLRRQFVFVFVSFSVILTALGGWLTWRTTRDVLERELDDKLRQVAGAAAEVGLEGDLVLLLQPGDEESLGFTATYQRLRRLQRYVDRAYIFRRDLTALVTTIPPDSLPIGTPLRFLETYSDEIARAFDEGEATSPTFYQEEDGRYYKYGFVRLEQSDAMLAVLMRANFLEPLDDFRRTIVLGSLLAAVLAAIIAGLLAATITEPLERLGRAAIRIQRGRMEEPVAEERGVELGRLSRAMERMRAGILHRDEQLRLMLAQVAHEIRNPLGGLELFASAAAETEDPEERRRLLARVQSEVVALNEIIDDFLAFARPVRAEPRSHDLRVPVREAAELVEGELRENGGELELELPEDPLPGLADPEQVKRLTLNLLRNAAQAGGTVRVRMGVVGEEVLLAVSDDGPGIAPELRGRIFEPFVTDKEQGAGLGLAIVRRLVEANGGRIEVDPGGDGVGRGAEFRVYFRGSPGSEGHPAGAGSGTGEAAS